MSRLTVYGDDAPDRAERETADAAEIARILSGIGILFEQWQTAEPLPAGASEADVFAAYAAEIDRLKARGGYQSIDVARLLPGNPAAAEIRAKFLSEHTHADDEVRFFVEGSGQFYLHIDGRIYIMLCEAGDLISVPAGTRHWFDAGADPSFTAIRLFVSPDGWIANYTGDRIADVFPKYETVAA